MPEITISYIEKNASSHLGKKVVQTDHLPRVGELVYNKAMFDRSKGEGYVVCVAYEVVGEKIKHHIVVREGHQTPGEESFNDYSLLGFIDFES